MRYLLDTNACVDYLRGRYPKVVSRIQESSPAYGRLRAGLEAAGRPIGPNDMLIAAHALSRGCMVVTDNVSEFGRVKGLRVVNWR